MGYIDITKLNTGENSNRTLGTIKINGVVFKSIGHGMLQTANIVSMREQPGREMDFSLKDINRWVRRAIPRLVIGFKWIDADEFVKLRQILLKREEMTIEYYDNDFGKYVTHKMYPDPDEPKAFESLGQMVRGVTNFSVTFVGTMNDEPTFSVTREVNNQTTTVVYSPSDSYEVGTVVKSDQTNHAQYYVCLRANNGSPLANTTYWELLDLSVGDVASVKWGEMFTVPDMPSQYLTQEGKTFAKMYIDQYGEEYYVDDSVLVFEDLRLRAVYN